MLNDIATIFWIFLPSLANAGPVIAKRFNFLNKLNYPLDLNKSYRGKRIFGDHKTFRGLLAGVVVGFFIALLQMLLYSRFDTLSNFSYTLDYSSPSILLLGMLIGFGAITGDAIKSFFKRQAGKAPGENWPPFDQIDFALGVFIITLPFFVLPFRLYIIGFLIAIIIHPLTNILAWLLRLQDKPF